MPKVYVLILNWNGWKDTIECLESVFRLDYPNFRVIVCDNASQDRSLEHIKAWAEGALPPPESPLGPSSPYSKPIALIKHDRSTVGSGGSDADTPLVLIQTEANLGFAGGNNVGLRYALARGDAEFVWVLNNDTVVAPDALSHLVRRMRLDQRAGLCGSTLRFYSEPGTVQTLGGSTYNKWLARPRPIGLRLPADQPIDAARVEASLAYVAGASMLASRAFLNEVGLMSEHYFLYFEELDWILRANGRYGLVYAPDSVVYHKEGASIGSNTDAKRSSALADYFSNRNRLELTRRFFPFALPTVRMVMLAGAIRRMARLQWRQAAMIMNLALGKRDRGMEGVRPSRN